jgi:hypothetical protein
MGTIYKNALKRLIEEVEYIISNNNAIDALIPYWDRISDNSFYKYANMSFYWDSINRTSKVLDNHPDSKAYWYLYRKKQKIIDGFLLINNLKIEEIESYTKKFKTIRDQHLCHIDKKSINNPHKIFLSADIHFGPFNNFIIEFSKLLISLYEIEFGTKYKLNVYNAQDLIKNLHETYPN